MSSFKILASLRNMMIRTWAACMALACVLGLTGCTAIRVKLGTRVYLDKIPVTSMDARLAQGGPGIAPGEKLPLVVTFTGADGKPWVTEGAGHGKVLWKDLQVTATVAAANQKGVVSLPHDPRISEGKVPHVAITVPSHPDLHAEFDIPVRYDYSYVSSFSGSSGSSGFNGSDGMDGSSGSSGSFDPDHPSAGRDGGDGTSGGDGSDGGSGGDGPPVQVRVALRAGSHPLLQVIVSAPGHDRRYLVDPQGGSLTVKSLGGPGGSGGKGGRGGRGGSGGMGSPSGRSGSDGRSGRDGSDGSSGRGGRIAVMYDPQAKPFLGVISLSNPGGPRPVFLEEPVAPLW